MGTQDEFKEKAKMSETERSLEDFQLLEDALNWIDWTSARSCCRD